MALRVRLADLDFEIFVDRMKARLDDWLAGRGREAAEELKASVRWVAETLGGGTLAAEREMLRLLYLGAVISVAERPVVKVPPAGALPGMEVDWGSRESIEAYIEYLDGAGEDEAAAHVRKAVAAFGLL